MSAARISGSIGRFSFNSPTFMIGFFTFDFGESMWTGKPILEEVGLRFELSLQVAIMATLVAIVIAIPLGAISAIHQDTWLDYAVRTFSIAGIAIPSFWLGIMIILGLLIFTNWIRGYPGCRRSNTSRFGSIRP